MIAASHIITGAATGALCRRARVAVPVAFVSHFVLDQIPHSCFNMLPAAAWKGWVGAAVISGMAVGFALGVWGMLLAWRLPTRWVSVAAAAAAFAPDPLSYMHPISTWFAMLPGAWVVPWVHKTFHCDVTRDNIALGFATQVVVIAAGLYVLARRRRK